MLWIYTPPIKNKFYTITIITMKEIWKEIPWLPKWKYFVSNLGRVKNWNVKTRKWKILKFESNRYWHQRVKLYWAWGGKDVKHYQVHRLVYCVFNNLDYNFWLYKNISKSIWLVCHKDNNPLNNKIDNLYMWTQKENMQQCNEEWRMIIPKWMWEKNPNSKLVKEDIIRIRELYNQGMKYNDIANLLWVSKSTICNICRFKTRNHVSL